MSPKSNFVAKILSPTWLLPLDVSQNMENDFGPSPIQKAGTGSMRGFPAENLGRWGYNIGSIKYDSVWLYTMGTDFLPVEGFSSDEDQEIRWKFTSITNLMTGKMPNDSDGTKKKEEYIRTK